MENGIIILAAGSSSRLGKPKQLLSYKGKSLLEIATEAAIGTGAKAIVTVLGAYADEISATHQQAGINYVMNERWENGMSTSIHAGLAELLKLNPATENVMIMVSDQAFLTTATLMQLVEEKQHTEYHIIASKYGNTIGTPVLFNKKYFTALMNLSGDTGAKHLIQQHPKDVGTISFEKGDIDIDTEADYDNLTKQQ
ncbi:nucleotidyltransferase family protein [Pedobacter frigiditerrae]|uniref:Nucleotidyltransferase family protein n=1 Tax=Pedobacter frigiditerrae TaxID=2530452 RepID=A0A4R0MTM6_9SPHI|nr:nucleotidyltransferase family protein [Pedobacter frigiditerrae]TCC90143.1 nucleotidyltransferase family protein [Pedobacter frigiditerrae]